MTLDPPESLRLSADALAEMLAPAFGAAPVIGSVEPLAGDASTRCYFRLRFSNEKAPVPAAIVMQLEEPQAQPLDWLAIHDYLQKRGLPVPRVFHYEAGAGLLLIEDLGDLTLEQVLRVAGADAKHDWYNKAVDLVAELQLAAVDPEGPAFSRRFDVEKLMWEMQFMVTHFVGGYLQSPPAGEVRSRVERELESLCVHLESCDPCFTHRDYHSRNLMVAGDRLVMIDFQDARLGPAVYDLVSLLRDSYVTLDEAFVEDKKNRYLERRSRAGGKPLDPVKFNQDFDMMSIQRNLKAIGTFAFQVRERNNLRYEPCIEPTLAMVRRTLISRPELAGLQAALESLHPSFRS